MYRGKKFGFKTFNSLSNGAIYLKNIRINPNKKRFKTIIIQIVFFILGRALSTSSKFDRVIKKELETWPENFKLIYKVDPNGPSLSLKKMHGCLHRSQDNNGEMVIRIKSIEIAFLLLTARIGTVQAFIEHRATIKGDVTIGMSLIRILNRVQTYMFPRIIAKRLIKRLPNIPWYSRYYGRIRIMFLGVPFGI